MKFKFFKKKANYPKDFSASSIKICEDVKEYTMTGKLRVNALIEAVKYVTIHNIDGAFVECGVWKGGSSMAMALALKNLGVMNKAIYMYDTFGGMTEPTTNDVSLHDENAVEIFEKLKLTNIVSKYDDGNKGWVEQIPFDRIIFTAASKKINNKIFTHIENDGIIVCPIVKNNKQILVKYKKQNNKIISEEYDDVLFVPMLQGVI